MYWTGVSRRSVPRAGSTRKVGMADIMPDSTLNPSTARRPDSKKGQESWYRSVIYSRDASDYQGLPWSCLPSPASDGERLRRPHNQQENRQRSDPGVARGGLRQRGYIDPVREPD